MFIKREIKRLFKYVIALGISVIAVLYVIFDSGSQINKGKEREIIVQQASSQSLDLLLSFVKEKSSIEIALNTIYSNPELLSDVKKWENQFTKKVERFLKFLTLHGAENKELKFLRQAVSHFDADVKKSLLKITQDLKRDTKILDLDDWSVFSHKIIQKFLADIGLLINNNHYAKMCFGVSEILINMHSEYVMHNVMMYKNIKDYLTVLTANTSDVIENNFRKIKNQLLMNKLEDKDVVTNINNLSALYDAFKTKINSDNPISAGEFGKIVDSLESQIKFLNLKENAFLRSDSADNDNTNSILLSAAIFLVICVLLFGLSRYLFYFVKFSKLTKEDIAKENYTNLGFISNFINVSKEYLENFVYTAENIDVSNIVPITSVNVLKRDNANGQIPDKAFEDICTIVREINLCNAKIFDNIKFLKEKAGSLNVKREKLCEIANFNLSEDIHEEIKKCKQEIDGFYKLDSFDIANEITTAEFSYLFEKFHELSFNSDRVKNIFLELVSEIKLLTLNSAMSGNDMNAVHAKLQDIINNVLSKVNMVNAFNLEANKTYAKTNALLGNLVKVANAITSINEKLDEKVTVTQKSIERFLNHFKTICTHYELILGNSNIEKTELENVMKILNNTRIQIENTNTKVNNIIANVEAESNANLVKTKDIG